MFGTTILGMTALLIGVAVGWALDRIGLYAETCKCGELAELKAMRYHCDDCKADFEVKDS